MMTCWTKLPDKRPSFSNIVSTISNYAEVVAGYLDITCYNPFESKYSTIGRASESPDNDRDILAFSASTEPLVQKTGSGSTNSEDKKKKQCKSSPSVLSPQVPPALNLSNLKEGSSTTSSAGIEIRIQSPSESENVANKKLNS